MMKTNKNRILAILLCIAMLLISCTPKQKNSGDVKVTNSPTKVNSIEHADYVRTAEYIEDLGITSLDEPKLLDYIESVVYEDLIDELGDNYFIENVDAIYISKEYLEALEYNSKENVFFGYSLSELENQFQGTKYIFDVDSSGKTCVHEYSEIEEDNTFDKVIKNVVVGTGVILICVTVSAVTGGAGAPAVSVIFASSAKSATVFALSSGVVSGVSAGVVEGIKTKNFDKAVKAAALAGSESYKWGAFAGALTGGVSKAISLKGATINGLNMNEAAIIQKESKYPLDIIKQLKSMKEYQVYKDAGLIPKVINGKIALIPEGIDLSFKSVLPDGTEVTNLQRALRGYAPLDPATGKSYQLHHIGQKADGTLAVLTEAQHQGNSAILNTFGKESEIDRIAFDKIRSEFWKSFAKIMG